MGEALAVDGGPRTIPEDMIQPWPPVDDTDRNNVLASLEGHKYPFGPNSEAFQQEFAAWNGNKFAVATNSGTAGLHMGVAACDCGPGDEVIVPAYSWSSSVTCVLHHNAIPVFVDIDYDTINMDVDKLEAAITPRTKAIVVVHLHGLAVNMDKVMEVAGRHGLRIIEDCCQGHGATYKGRKVGTWGDCASFSGNQNKLLCTGEGGAFVTDNEEILAKANAVLSFGESRDPVDEPDYHAYAMGWKYHMNDIVAAFARAQLAKLDGYLERIAENTAVLTQGLQDVPHLALPVEPANHKHNWYNYTLRFDMESLGRQEEAAVLRDGIVQALNAEGVPNGVWQRYPLPAMTVFRAKNAYGRGCPWTWPGAAEVDYSVAQYPEALRHCDRHTCLSMALRPPNAPDVAKLVAQGIRKVMENVDKIPTGEK